MMAPSPALRPVFRFAALLALALSQVQGADLPSAPDWAQPGSATHQQVPPPKDFRRASKVSAKPIGQFDGQAEVGSSLVEGKAFFDQATGAYTIHSAGYNIWYHRDEFTFLWKKMSGDVSLAADIEYPNAEGYFDRKAVLIFRQDLDDDSKEIMVALHGGGLIHLAQRGEKGADLAEAVRMDAPKQGDTAKLAKRLGITKEGDQFHLLVSMDGEPMEIVGKAAILSFKEPFYVGIGFCSHLPVTVDTAVLTHVELKPGSHAGK